MILLPCQERRIQDLYDVVYGLPAAAEMIMNEYPTNSITEVIIRNRWKNAGKEIRKRADVVNELVSEAYKACNKNLERMKEYIDTEKVAGEFYGKKIKRIYLGIRTVERTAEELGLRLITRPRGKPFGGKCGRRIKLQYDKEKPSKEERRRRKWLLPPEIAVR